jgi:hypothetical protein
MKDWMFIAIVYLVFAIGFVGWYAIRQRKKKNEEDKEFVAKFLRGIFPNSATPADISDYTGFTFLRVSDILYSLVKDKRVQEGEFGFISTELGNKYYPPKLRLIRCN